MNSIDSNTKIELRGFVEAYDDGTFLGWARTPEKKNSVEIEIRIEGKSIVRAIASRSREDLQARFPHSDAHAFEISLPKRWIPKAHAATLHIVSDGHTLEFLRGARPTFSMSVDPRIQFPTKSQQSNYTFFPDYSSTNPYQTLLSASLPGTLSAEPGTIDEAIQKARVLKQTFPGGSNIFHLHWTTPILGPCESEWEARVAKDEFLRKLSLFTELGGFVVWTVHNALSHDQKFSAVEKELCAGIVVLSSIVHVHSKKALEQTADHYLIPTDKAVVIPHPNYINVYQNYVDNSTARRRLGISEDKKVFGFIGQLRPYKGISELISSFEELQHSYPDAHLLIAGKPVHPYSVGTVSAMCKGLPNVTIVEGHIPDNELQWYFNACDFVPLPYSNVLTSGSALNALSFGRPVIAPAIGMIPEVIQHGVNGYLYEPDLATGLLDTLKIALATGEHEQQSMNSAAVRSVEHLTWKDFGSKLAEAINELTKLIQIEFTSPAKNIKALSTRSPQKGARRALVAIVVLNYMHLGDVRRLLRSLSQSTCLDFEVLVIDNHSPGTTIAKMRSLSTNTQWGCTALRTEENLGYAAGNNIGIRFALTEDFEFIWILNPDTEVTTTTLQTLLDAAKQNPDVNVFGSTILYGHEKDKVWFAGATVGFTHGLQTQHYFNGMDVRSLPTQPFESEYITGASLFCRREAFRDRTLIPEEYFLYFEETDWCLQLRARGERLLIVPDSRLYHHKRSEEGNIPSLYYFFYYVRNAIIFTNKFSNTSLRATEIRLESTFIRPWLEKVRASKPNVLPIYQGLAAIALVEGKQGKTGYRDLAELVFKLEHGKVPDRLYSGLSAELTVRDTSTIEISLFSSKSLDPNLKLSLYMDGRHQSSKSLSELKVGVVGTAEIPYKIFFPAPLELWDGQNHDLDLRIDGHLSSSPLAVEPQELYKFKARIDGYSNNVVQGWVVNLHNDAHHPAIEIWIDDEQAAVTYADIPRPDLKKAGYGSGSHGFAVRVPSKYADGRERRISLRVVGEGAEVAQRSLRAVSSVLDVPSGGIAPMMGWLYRNREARYPLDKRSSTLKFFDGARNAITKKYESTSKELLVSVIMPAYNREDTIGSSITSVLNQSYKNFELIIIDDGSSDSTCAVIKEHIQRYPERNILMVELDSNQGVSRARNAGLEQSKGELIAYLDSDNVWEADFLEIMVGSLHEHPKADSAYCGQSLWHVVSPWTSNLEEPIAFRLGAFDLGLIENKNYIDLNCFVHRRSQYVRLGGFNTKMRRLVDWELIWRFSFDRKPIFVPALLSRYFFDKASNQITSLERYEPALAEIRNSFSTFSASFTDLLNEHISLEKVDVALIFDCDEAWSSYFAQSAFECQNLLESLFVIVEESQLSKALEFKASHPRLVIQVLPYTADSEGSKTNALQRAAQQSRAGSGLLFISSLVELTKHCFVHLLHAAKICPGAGMVIPRRVGLKNTLSAGSYSPYATGPFPVALQDGEQLQDAAKFEIDEYIDHLEACKLEKFSCALVPPEARSVIDFPLLADQSVGEIFKHVSEVMHFALNMPTVRASRAKAFVSQS